MSILLFSHLNTKSHKNCIVQYPTFVLAKRSTKTSFIKSLYSYKQALPDQGSRAMGSGSAVILRDQGSGYTTFVVSGTQTCHAFGIKDQQIWVQKWDHQ